MLTRLQNLPTMLRPTVLHRTVKIKVKITKHTKFQFTTIQLLLLYSVKLSKASFFFVNLSWSTKNCPIIKFRFFLFFCQFFFFGSARLLREYKLECRFLSLFLFLHFFSLFSFSLCVHVQMCVHGQRKKGEYFFPDIFFIFQKTQKTPQKVTY